MELKGWTAEHPLSDREDLLSPPTENSFGISSPGCWVSVGSWAASGMYGACRERAGCRAIIAAHAAKEFPIWVRQNSPWGFSYSTAPWQVQTSESQPGPIRCYRLGDTAAICKWKILVVATSTFQTKTWAPYSNIEDWFQSLGSSVSF